MHSRLAALLAVCVTLAMSQPRLGLVVHHHAGAGRLHVHAELGGHSHGGEQRDDGPHAHEAPAAHAGQEHDHEHDHDELVPRSDGETAGGHDIDHHHGEPEVGHHAGDHGLVARFRAPADDHDVAHHDELAARSAPPPVSDDTTLTAGSFRVRWHTHSTQPFHHADLPVPPLVQAPQPGARLALLPPHRRGEAEPVPGRSRAPPSLQSS